MADTIKTDNSLNIGLEYTDADNKTKTIYLKTPNPRNNITETEIRNAMNTFINAQIVLDPEGNPFSTTSVSTAYTLNEQKVSLDVGWNG